MRRIRRLHGVVQHYAWGSHRALADFRGEPVPSAEPEAELWLGAHPRGPACLGDASDASATDPCALPAAIACDPEAALGSETAGRFDARLPFLLKVLAVGGPLSVQAHPDAQQAREGFAAENARGIAVDAPERNYRDPAPKPELVCALSPFSALRGFRTAGEIRVGLEALGLGDVAPRGEGDGDGALRGFFETWMGMESGERATRLARAVPLARQGAARDPALAWLARLQEAHPGDPGVLAPLFLNLVVLEPGSAMFLPAGELHCYLDGLAVELMASSDNVLRGGLTPKHVDAAELMRILRFDAGPPEPLVATPRPGAAWERVYGTPAAEFELSRLDAGQAPAGPIARPPRPEILLCGEGSARVIEGDDPAGGGLLLERGMACFVPAAAGPYRLAGSGMLFRASVPA